MRKSFQTVSLERLSEKGSRSSRSWILNGPRRPNEAFLVPSADLTGPTLEPIANFQTVSMSSRAYRV